MPDEGKPTKPKRAGNPNPVQHRIPEEQYAAARILYESVPGMSFAKLAKEAGISERALEEKSRKEGWKKKPLLTPHGMGEAAQEAADKYVGKLADYGTEITPEQKTQALTEVLTETAAGLRGQIIERHRREWGAVRALLYDTLKKKQYGDHAKLAKISAETLQIIQSNERKAWGIEKDTPDTTVVVIDRS